MNDNSEVLKSIGNTLYWCSVWLFFIMLNTCSIKYNTTYNTSQDVNQTEIVKVANE